MNQTDLDKCLDEVRGKIPRSEMWCGCLGNEVVYREFSDENHFIQHLLDEHKSSIPDIVMQIKENPTFAKNGKDENK